MAARRRRRLSHGATVPRVVPNMVTILGLCAGMTAVRFATESQWRLAVAAIMVAGILDGLDGRVARMLKGVSRFGAELDSLSDIVCFGVAPALVLYLWVLDQFAGAGGWAVALLLTVATALRLARFNTMLGAPSLPPWAHNFFQGVPAPAGAAIALLPMALTFQFGPGTFDHPLLVASFVVLAAALMVSTVPTWSLKRTRIPRGWVPGLLLLVGLGAALAVSHPWGTLAAVGGLYLGSIPHSLMAFRQQKHRRTPVSTDEGAP